MFQYIPYLLGIIRFGNASRAVCRDHGGHGFRVNVHAVILGVDLSCEKDCRRHYDENLSFHDCFIGGL